MLAQNVLLEGDYGLHQDGNNSFLLAQCLQQEIDPFTTTLMKSKYYDKWCGNKSKQSPSKQSQLQKWQQDLKQQQEAKSSCVNNNWLLFKPSTEDTDKLLTATKKSVQVIKHIFEKREKLRACSAHSRSRPSHSRCNTEQQFTDQSLFEPSQDLSEVSALDPNHNHLPKTINQTLVLRGKSLSRPSIERPSTTQKGKRQTEVITSQITQRKREDDHLNFQVNNDHIATILDDEISSQYTSYLNSKHGEDENAQRNKGGYNKREGNRQIINYSKKEIIPNLQGRKQLFENHCQKLLAQEEQQLLEQTGQFRQEDPHDELQPVKELFLMPPSQAVEAEGNNLTQVHTDNNENVCQNPSQNPNFQDSGANKEQESCFIEERFSQMYDRSRKSKGVIRSRIPRKGLTGELKDAQMKQQKESVFEKKETKFFVDWGNFIAAKPIHSNESQQKKQTKAYRNISNQKFKYLSNASQIAHQLQIDLNFNMEGNQLLKAVKTDKNKQMMDISPLCPPSEIDYPQRRCQTATSDNSKRHSSALIQKTHPELSSNHSKDKQNYSNQNHQSYDYFSKLSETNEKMIYQDSQHRFYRKGSQSNSVSTRGARAVNTNKLTEEAMNNLLHQLGISNSSNGIKGTLRLNIHP